MKSSFLAAIMILMTAAAVHAQGGISVVIPTCADAWYAENNKSCSPEQRERAAQKKREQDAADQRQRAEQERKNGLVARETARLGAHRADEARRLVEMREAAAAARGKPAPAGGIMPSVKQCEKVPAKGTMTSMPEGASLLFTGFMTRGEAEASTKRKMEKGCLAWTGIAGGSLGNMVCSQDAGRWKCEAAYTCTGMATRKCSNSQ